MRNKNLKRFLTTASALGMIAIGAQGAQAAALNTVGNGGAAVATGANLTVPFVAGVKQDLAFANAQTLDMNVAGAVVGGTYITANAGITTITENATFGSIVTDGTAGNDMQFKLTIGKTLTLDGAAGGANVNAAARVANLYSGLGANSTIDFNGTNGVVDITATGATFANAFDNVANGAGGVLKVTGASNIFTGKIGNTSNLTSINVNNNATFKGAVIKGTTITIADDKTMTLDSTTNAIVVIGATRGAAAGNGTLVMKGANAITHTGAIGDVAALEGLTINTTTAAGNTTITGATTIKGDVTITNAAGATATFTGGALTTTNGGNIDATNAAGIVALTGGGTIDGTIKTGAGNLTTGAALEVTNSANAAAGVVIGAGGIAAGHTVKVTSGNLDLSAATAASTFVNAVTVTKGNFVTGDGLVTLKTAGGLTMAAANSEVTVGAGGLVLEGVNATFTNGGKIQLNGNALTANSNAAAVTIAATANAADIVTNTAGTGTVNLIADHNALDIKGNIGAADKAVALIAVTGDNVATIGGANSTTTVVAATKTTIANGSTLAVNSAANSIAYSGVIDGDGAVNRGTLTINGAAGKTVTFNNAIGSTTNTIQTIAHGGVARGDAIYKDTVKVGTDITSANASVVVFEKAVEAGRDITLTAANTTNTFNDTVKTVRDVTLAANSKATFKGAATIGRNVDVNTSTITFDANAAITGNLTANAAGISTITFNDTATIGGTVTVNGGSTLTFAKDVTVTGNTITLTAAADKLNIRGNVHGRIVSNGDGKGIVTFGNGTNANITVDGAAAGVGIGAAAGNNRVASVNLNLSGGTLTVANGTYAAQNTTFTTDGTLVLSADAGSELGIVTTAIAGGAGTIVVKQAALTTTGAIGTNGYGIKELRLAHANGTLNVGHAIVGNVTTAAANTGTVSFAAALNHSGLKIGTEAAPLSQVTANGNATTVGTIYAKDILTAGAALTADAFNGTVNVTAANSVAIVNNKGTIGTVITKANNEGAVTLTGSATMTGPVGATGAAIATLNLAGTAATNVVTFKDDAIFATTVNHDAATFKLEKATTITSTDYNATGSTFDIGANVLNLTTDNLNISGDIKVNMSMGDRDAVFTGINTLVTKAATDKVTLNISSGGGLLAGTNLITLFENRAGAALVSVVNALTSTNVTLGTNTNRFITSVQYLGTADEVKKVVDAAVARYGVTPAEAAAKITAGKLVITSSASLDKLTTSPKKPGVSEFANQMVTQFNDGTLKGDALKFANTLGDLSLEDSTKALTAVADRSVADVGNNVTGATVAAVTQAMTGRLDLTNTMLTASADQGIAAGDSAEKFGVWGQVIGGTATQRMRKEVSGFQSRMAGILVGGDTMISDKTTIGVLAGNAGSNVKHKDSKAGDKTKANSWLFGLYGSYDRIADTNFFTQGNLTVAQTTVNVKEGRIGAPTAAAVAAAAAAVPAGQAAGSKETAKAKYDVLGLAAEAIVGYKFMFDNSYVAPTVGLRYNYFGDTSYTQTGTANQNMKVASKATSTVSGLAGLKLGTSVDMDGTNIMPEVHANVSYAFNAPSVKTTYAIDGMKDVAYKGPKAAKFGANFGAGVMAEADGFEYGVGYDANVGDKYLAHQGSLKVKVKF